MLMEHGSGISRGFVNMSNEYLMKEYELCFEQLRYYDTRHSEILKYVFSLTSAVATAQFAVYKFLKSPTEEFFACQAFLSAVVFIATLLFFMAMLQNRLYFVYIARQLNAIRGFLMRTEAEDFKDNQLYTSTDFSALKPSSVHTFQLIGTALISSLFAGLSCFAISPALGNKKCIGGAIAVTIIIALAEIVGGIKYLRNTDKRSADETIHGTNSAKPEPVASADAKKPRR